jgi:hypothetical protein
LVRLWAVTFWHYYITFSDLQVIDWAIASRIIVLQAVRWAVEAGFHFRSTSALKLLFPFASDPTTLPSVGLVSAQ